MACYQCNGEEGDEVRLCSKCNEERREELKVPFPAAADLPPPPFITPSGVLNLSGLVGAICVSLYIICYAPFGPGYGLPLSEQAFRRCNEKLTADAPGQAKQEAKEPKEIEKLTKTLLGKVGPTCEGVRAACEQSPNNEKCKAVF